MPMDGWKQISVTKKEGDPYFSEACFAPDVLSFIVLQVAQ